MEDGGGPVPGGGGGDQEDAADCLHKGVCQRDAGALIYVNVSGMSGRCFGAPFALTWCCLDDV